MTHRRNSRWYLCVPVAIVSLLCVDVLVRFWQPSVERLPEQFSPAYLQRLVDRNAHASPVVFLGDSVLWGYRLPAKEAAPSLLQARLPGRQVMNLSYEGGSSANSYFMLRLLLARGLRPALVVFNVNSKETNAADSAYRRLQPSLEASVAPLLTANDTKRLELQPHPKWTDRLDSAVASVWALYRFRTDVREAIFGTDDAATWAKNTIAHFTGSEALLAAEHQPTVEHFLGTYDLAPLDSDNVDYSYLKELGALVKSERIPAIAFLTPTNHQLLKTYIDDPAYDAKLRELSRSLRASGIQVLNLDRAFGARDFLDNDHLTASANARLAGILLPKVRASVAR